MRYWPLVKKLTLREIKARYKQSFLGLFWIILNPFFQMIIMAFVFSKIMRIDNLGVPYPIFLYAGLLPWTFFANSLSGAMGVLVSNSSLIKKIYFPREILVLATLLAKTFDFFLAAIVFILLMIWYKISFTLFMFFFFPIFLIQFIFTFGFSLILASLNLFYRDTQYLFNLILTLWFYLTPVIYSVDYFPKKLRWIFKINPLSVFINAYRKVLLGGYYPNFESLAIGVIISLILFLISYKIFKKLEKEFADVV